MITEYIIGQSYFLELLTNLNFREKGNFAIASYVHEMPPLPPPKKNKSRKYELDFALPGNESVTVVVDVAVHGVRVERLDHIAYHHHHIIKSYHIISSSSHYIHHETFPMT